MVNFTFWKGSSITVTMWWSWLSIWWGLESINRLATHHSCAGLFWSRIPTLNVHHLLVAAGQRTRRGKAAFDGFSHSASRLILLCWPLCWWQNHRLFRASNTDRTPAALWESSRLSVQDWENGDSQLHKPHVHYYGIYAKVKSWLICSEESSRFIHSLIHTAQISSNSHCSAMSLLTSNHLVYTQNMF